MTLGLERKVGAEQHAAHSVMRAVESGLPVLRCGNAGAGWIDPFGRKQDVLLDEEGSVYLQCWYCRNFYCLNQDFLLSKYRFLRLFLPNCIGSSLIHSFLSAFG